VSRVRLNGLFPRLEAAGYEITSPATRDYNCLAWAAGDTTRWWDGDKTLGYYWPPQAADGKLIEAFMHALSLSGYRPCENGDLEPGFEKVAIYGIPRDRDYLHAARQLPNGEWTSKIGALEDIRHVTVEALYSGDYGIVLKYMRREVAQGAVDATATAG
jgi:hypothetical protein